MKPLKKKKSEKQAESPQNQQENPENVPAGEYQNPDFETALQETNPESPEIKKDGRGGARPGAGRPKGLTADKAAVRALPDMPNQSLVQGLNFVFALWESRAGVPGIALTKEESESLALPLTQLQEYYFPGVVPEIGYTWANAICLTFMTVYGRIALIRELKKQQAAIPAENIKINPMADSPLKQAA